MTSSASGLSDGDDPTILFEEYLALSEAGEAPDLESFSARAGARSGELRERLVLLRQFEGLAQLLSEELAEDLELCLLGRYEVGELLGEGGLSRVFRATDPVLGRDVALKVLLPQTVHLRDARDWMVSEGRSLARLEHDSIVKVYDVDESRGFAYIAMERIAGPSLFQVLEAMRALRTDPTGAGHSADAVRAARHLEPIVERCRLIARIARALDYCHENGVLHRDVKPGNVLLDAAHTPKLIDFGLSRRAADSASLHLTQHLAGSPAYLAPEQVDQRRSGDDPASDQFSLGVVMYELLTLEHPFARETRSDTLSAISTAAPRRLRALAPAVPADVERICLHCLERLPAHRYPSIGRVAADIEAFLDHRAISVEPPSALKVGALWVRRHRRPLALISAGVLSVMAILAVNANWTRERLAAELGEREAFVGQLQDPDEFEALFRLVSAGRTRARDLDRTMLAGIMYRRVTPVLDELWRAGSARLHEVVEPEYAEDDRLSVARRDVLHEDLAIRWGGALQEELSSKPFEVEHDSPLHHRGRVRLPQGGRLFVYHPDKHPQLPVLEEVFDRERLRRGFYRFMTTDAAGRVQEREFAVHPQAPGWELALRSLPGELERGLALVPAREFFPSFTVPDEFRQLAADTLDVSVPITVERFEILERLVSWRDVAAVLDEPQLAAIPSYLVAIAADRETGGELDAPALLSWRLAQEYADRVGARLPTPPELAMAYLEGAIATHDGRVVREWVSTSFGTSRHSRYQFRCDVMPKEPGADVNTAQWAQPNEPDSLQASCGFRIARSRP